MEERERDPLFILYGPLNGGFTGSYLSLIAGWGLDGEGLGGQCPGPNGVFSIADFQECGVKK